MKIFSIFFLFLFSIAATETFAVDFTVNLTTDQHDASTTDGACDIDLAAAGEQCTVAFLTTAVLFSIVIPATPAFPPNRIAIFSFNKIP
jgi:hypothetical protein